MEKFNPFNDWFFKTNLEVSEQEKEQIEVLLKGVNSCFKVKNKVITNPFIVESFYI